MYKRQETPFLVSLLHLVTGRSMVGVYTESLVLQVRRRSACQTDTKAPERFPEHGKTNDGIYAASRLCRGGYAISTEQSVYAGVLALLHVRRHVSPEGSARALVVSVVLVVRFCRYEAMLYIHTHRCSLHGPWAMSFCMTISQIHHTFPNAKTSNHHFSSCQRSR